MTLYKRSLELQQQLRSQLDGLAATAEGEAALEQSAALDGVAKAVQQLGDDLAKMKAKAQEPDPDKRVYGKGMTDKVLALAADTERLRADVSAARAQLAPAADAERRRQQEAAAAAQREAEQQQQRDAEAAQQNAREEERQRQEAAAAAEQAARLEQARQDTYESCTAPRPLRLEEAEQKRKADLAAAQEAARQKAAAAAAEQRRLAEERKAEVLRKQQEELKARQEAQAAAARKAAAERAATPRAPMYDAMGALVHLRGGQAELDGILRLTGEAQLVVLDFSAAWCGPCRMMEPVLAGWARELGPRVVLVSCDAEAPGNRALAAASGIRAFPTFHIYRGGRVVGQVQGADRGRLRSLIDAETRLLAPLEGGPSPAVALATAMSAMKGSVPAGAFQAAAQTLLAYVRNLVAHPDDPKFRRIKSSNARYKAAIGSQPHGTACMAALGFRPLMEASEEVLVLEHPSPELPQVKVLLEQAMALNAQRAAGAPRATAPAAGPAPGAAAASAAAARAASAGAAQPAAQPTAPAAQRSAVPQPSPATTSAAAAGAPPPQIAQLLAQQLAAAFAASQSAGQPSGGTATTQPAASQPATGSAAPQGGTSDGGGGSGATATEAPATVQQGQEDSDDDEALARALQESMDGSRDS